MVINKRMVGAIAAGGVILVSLSAIGTWQADSPNYWRAVGQRVLLAAAEQAGGGAAVRIGHLALRIHPAGLTTEELARTATVFKTSGRDAQAALLWLVVAHDRMAAGQRSEADAAARNAHQAFPTQATTTTLLLLHWNDAERDAWVTELARYAPDHEIVKALICLGDVTSFDADLPVTCQTPGWIAEQAAQSQQAYRKHLAELETLPALAARKALAAEMELTENRADLGSYGARFDALAEEHTNEKVKSFLVGTAKVLLPPLPKPTQTFGGYVKELVYCGTIGKLDCAMNDIGETIRQHGEYDRRWQEENASLGKLTDLTRQVAAIHEREMRTWASTGPFTDLVATRNSVLPDFRRSVQSQLFTRQLPIGLLVKPSLEAVLGAGPDGRVFQQLGTTRLERLEVDGTVPENLQQTLGRLRDLGGATQITTARVQGEVVDAERYAALLSSAVDDERAVVYRMGLPLQDPKYAGARVTAVQPNSTASAADLQFYDTIHAVNGVPVGSWNDLANQLRTRCGGPLVLHIYRQKHDVRFDMSIPATSAFPCLGIEGTDSVTDRGHVEVIGIPSETAQQAGVQNADLLVTVNRRWLSTTAEIRHEVQKYGREHGTPSKIPVTIRRNGKEMELWLPLSRDQRQP